MASHTRGIWRAIRSPYFSQDYLIQAVCPKDKPIIAVIPGNPLLGKFSDSEKSANIRLIESAPVMYDAICHAHDLCLDGDHNGSRDLLMAVIDLINEERIPENY